LFCDEHPEAYLAASDLFNSCHLQLQTHISAFFGEALFSGKSNESEITDSATLLQLIYELQHVAPTLLIYTLPQLIELLKVR
jgi:hypothetical protein